jgi:hypothetical protein
MWAQQLCEMPGLATPQQHEPSGTKQIDKWIVSAIRYLTHEFRQYSA